MTNRYFLNNLKTVGPWFTALLTFKSIAPNRLGETVPDFVLNNLIQLEPGFLLDFKYEFQSV